MLTVNTDWSWHQWNHLYGTFTYDGAPVFGFALDPTGQPLDSFGRNLYLDTFDSAYGTGWKRENSFLTHKGDGVFCYSVNPHGAPSRRHGQRVPGDDHGPRRHARRDVGGPAPGAYDKATDSRAQHRDLGPARRRSAGRTESTRARGTATPRAERRGRGC